MNLDGGALCSVPRAAPGRPHLWACSELHQAFWSKNLDLDEKWSVLSGSEPQDGSAIM